MVPVHLWVGGYPPPGKGILHFTLSRQDGSLHLQETVTGPDNPSFLAINHRWIFAAHELPDRACVASYRQEQSGTLSLVHFVEADGAGTCHLTLSPCGRFLYASNYRSGSILVAAVGKDGHLSTLETIKQKGSSIHPIRQAGAHIHSVTLSPDGHYAFAADLGCDRIWVYRVDCKSGRLSPHSDCPSLSLPPGEGPRHMAFHPNGRYAYLVTELGNHLYSYRFYAHGGRLEAMDRYNTLPPDIIGENLAADLHLSADGRFLYVSNRGHDSLAAWQVDGDTGELNPIGWYPTGGKGPRNFTLGPDGQTLLVVNQASNNLCIFRRNPRTGVLGEEIARHTVPSPAWIGWTGG